MGHVTWFSTWALLVLIIVTTVRASHLPLGERDILDGNTVLKLTSDDRDALRNVINHLTTDYNADVLFGGTNVAEVIVTSADYDDVVTYVAEMGVDFQPLRDIRRVLEMDYSRHRLRFATRSADVTNTYMGLNEMTNVLATVTKQAKDADVTLSSMGRSFEGRDMPFVEIREKDGDRKRETKPAIVIDAGIHAREWIAPAMALNIINKLALNPDDDDEVEDMLEMFDWVIAPCVNPDGYEYSRERPENRLWRKTRSDKHMNGTGCVGVDANRNFGFDWNPVSGASSDPCSSVFAGPAPFSEPETQNIRDWLDDLSDRAVMFVTMHAFGQFVLHPPAFNPNRTMDNEDVVVKVAETFAEVLNGTGRPYIVGSPPAILYPGSGSTMDYAWGGAAIPLSYTIELSPSFYFEEFPDDNFALGFLYPEEKLPDTVDATWNGFKAMARAIYDEAAEDDEEEDRRDV